MVSLGQTFGGFVSEIAKHLAGSGARGNALKGAVCVFREKRLWLLKTGDSFLP